MSAGPDTLGGIVMSRAIESLAGQIEQLPIHERMSLLERVLRDIRAEMEIQGEFRAWDELSDAALADFEGSL
ncbi:MAG: hypothetical protein HY719_01700 [Planctomycetes bacterium]|nr:hypothetical protein [Planctomycetota bacterium]